MCVCARARASVCVCMYTPLVNGASSGEPLGSPSGSRARVAPELESLLVTWALTHGGLERDRVYLERDRVYLERDRVYLERDSVYLERDRAYLERDRVLLGHRPRVVGKGIGGATTGLENVLL